MWPRQVSRLVAPKQKVVCEVGTQKDARAETVASIYASRLLSQTGDSGRLRARPLSWPPPRSPRRPLGNVGSAETLCDHAAQHALLLPGVRRLRRACAACVVMRDGGARAALVVADDAEGGEPLGEDEDDGERDGDRVAASTPTPRVAVRGEAKKLKGRAHAARRRWLGRRLGMRPAEAHGRVRAAERIAVRRGARASRRCGARTW